MRNISAKAYTNYKSLLKSNKFKNTFLKNFIFFNAGRDALHFGINELRIRKKSTILIPGYICSSTIKPLIKNGYKIKFYDIKKDFSLDLKKLEKAINEEDIGAIMIVHYFGFSNNIDEIYNLCKVNNVELIEDFCHSLFCRLSRNNIHEKLKTTKIYSLRKNFAILDGGALEKKDFVNYEKNQYYSISFKEIIFIFLKLIEKIINFTRFPNLYSLDFYKFKQKIKRFRGEYFSNKNRNLISITKSPSFLLNKYLTDNKYIINSSVLRIRNFNYLSKEIYKISNYLIHKKLSKNCVPQFLPIIEIDKNNLLYEFLNNNGVESIRWPNEEIPSYVLNNRNEFPNSNFLNKKLILLPVHQSLTLNDCNRIILLLENFYKKF